jgi:hypothetical protein
MGINSILEAGSHFRDMAGGENFIGWPRVSTAVFCMAVTGKKMYVNVEEFGH